jgi:predicted negative regulator of RcsB-dependent stress response
MTLSFFEDIDFDDEPETESHPRGRGRRGRRGGGGEEGPPRAPRGTASGRRRLLVAAAAIIVVIVVGWYWIRACQADAQRRAYENYVTDVNSVVKQSDDIGAKLDNAILDPTATKSKLVATVSSLAKSQAEVAASAAKLHDTGRLRGLQSWLDTVMNYRTQGLEGMSAALETAMSTNPVDVTKVQEVSNAYERLLASDVLYSDSFQRPATAALQKANINGVSLTGSQFALSPRYVYPPPLRLILQRTVDNGKNGTTGTASGAKVGTQLLKVVAEPSGKQLIPGGLVSIAAKPNNTFQVYVENSGQLPVTKVEVRFIESGHVQKQEIKIIDPGGVAHVIFTPKYVTPGVPTTITVRSVPVAHESVTSNNEATYKVEYSL